MTWYDFVMVGILIYATLRGAVKGVVWQIATIAAIVLCFFFAEELSLGIAPLVPGVEPPANRWVAMFLLYVGFSFISFGAARVFRGWIEKAKFVEYDRHLGAILGFVKGVTFCLVVTFFVVTLSANMRDTVMASRSGQSAAVIMDRMHYVMPDDIHDVLAPYIHRLDHPDFDLHHHHGNDSALVDSHDDHDHDADSSDDIHDDHDHAADDQSEISKLLNSLPGFVTGELKDLVTRALRNTRREDRDELLTKIRFSVPAEVENVVNRWREGKPADDPFGLPEFDNPPVVDPGDSTARAKLLQEISEVYYDVPEAQAAIIEETEQALAGVPAAVSLAVITDWHSDLLAIKPDPDPETDHTATLDTRLRRQLAAARISISSLSESLQRRLR